MNFVCPSSTVSSKGDLLDDQGEVRDAGEEGVQVLQQGKAVFLEFLVFGHDQDFVKEFVYNRFHLQDFGACGQVFLF